MVLGKVRALAIYFDSLNENNLPAFSGGDLVSGRVVVEVTGDVRVKSLDITARGVAKVRWTESRNAGANTAYTQNYTEEVEYLHHYDTLIGEERGKEAQHVTANMCEAANFIKTRRQSRKHPPDDVSDSGTDATADAKNRSSVLTSEKKEKEINYLVNLNNFTCLNDDFYSQKMINKNVFGTVAL
ncbi:arrestin domain-containing protein 3-like [Plectropomus leopardus]|uniref:arrestin domain-containing protein 3-like n=1 Tax=Plectropomus leopardus TaxID=160734 RepID=UPI001C4C509C|nr:arrestin domain-containing protein 3-like [Plectropomus leopardus]